MKLLTITEDENGGVTDIVMNLDALVNYFLLSVGNDTTWVPVTRGAVSRCYNDLWGTSDKKSCKVVPQDLYDIIDCVYLEHFLKCPVWNPKHVIECSYTYKYVDKCWKR